LYTELIKFITNDLQPYCYYNYYCMISSLWKICYLSTDPWYCYTFSHIYYHAPFWGSSMAQEGFHLSSLCVQHAIITKCDKF